MCRSLMPMISAACHHVIFFAMARKITSCTFIAHRGLRVREHACHVLLPSPPEKRTDHVLSQPDISCANDTARTPELTKRRRWSSVLRLVNDYWLLRSHSASSESTCFCNAYGKKF